MDNNEFDLDFDFEKEYGFDPKTIMDSESEDDDDLSFLKDLLGEEEPHQNESLQEDPFQKDPFQKDPFQEDPFQEDPFQEDPFAVEETPELFYDELPQEEMPLEDIGLDEIAPEDGFEDPFAADVPPADTEEPEAELPEQAEPAPIPRPRRNRRRRKRDQMRQLKEVYLPPIIAGVAVLLILIFVIGSIARAITRGQEKAENDKNAAQSQEDEATRLAKESKALMEEAAALAAGYDYEAAIAKLDSFSSEITAYPEMVSARSSYVQMQGQLKAWSDPSKVPNLSFHVLIADPARAFVDETYGKAYNKNFVTIDEFSKILQQLYDNGYVLVDLDDIFLATTSEDGATTYSANTIYLPEGKKPIMITETMVNYFLYMVDGDGNGEPDAKGDGFASRLVLDSDGNIKAEMVTAEGETVVGDYDLVPILNSFIEEHPDFSYRGARALLAVTGEEGIFGYRTNNSVISTRGTDYHDTQVAAAKKIVEALRNDGYTIACYTYANSDYGASSATEIQIDLSKWAEEVTPILGNVDILVYARASEITDYTDSRYNVLYDAGFRNFLGNAKSPWAEVNTNYIRQSRIMVTGTLMAYNASDLSSYFDAASVLNAQRGNVPT